MLSAQSLRQAQPERAMVILSLSKYVRWLLKKRHWIIITYFNLVLGYILETQCHSEV